MCSDVMGVRGGGAFVWKFFFFSSRRRHTRCSRDWSSDVCSSDLRLRTFVFLLAFGSRLVFFKKSHFDAHVGEDPRVQLQKRDANLDRGFLARSEEHTSELQSRLHLVCRLLLEKKKTIKNHTRTIPH